ncbi:MAG: outer membrane beta-barrel protein [Cytophagales bacterium]|nr:outer membrane beta-barrel protein [Cytophagales bacterium]
MSEKELAMKSHAKNILQGLSRLRNPALWILLTSLLFMRALPTYGQRVNCSQLLAQAEDQYDTGNLFPIPSLLSPCFETQAFSKEESVAAKKLITLVHIFTDSIAASQKAMEELLREDPEHQLQYFVDPEEIFYLYRKFRTRPIYRIGFRAIGNTNFVNTRSVYGVENNLNSRETARPGVLGGGGIEIEKEIGLYFEIMGGAQFSVRSYRLTNNLYDYSSYSLSESQYWVEVPLVFRWLLLYGQEWVPYVYLGGLEGYLVSSTLSGIREGGAVVNLGNTNLVTEGLRRKWNHSLMTGVGIKRRSPSRKTFWVMELSYIQGLINLADVQNRYTVSQDIPFRLGYVDNDFSISSIQISLSYIVSIYSPRLLERK